MTDTRTSTLPPTETPPGPPDTRPETLAEAAERAGLVLPSPVHRRWAVPLVVLAMLVLAAIAVASVLPSQWVASKENTRLGVEQGTPFARTPASAQPVDDRIVFGDLGAAAEQFPPVGDIYFVTVTEPAQSVLSWFVGRDEPAIQFLTNEEKFGVQTPPQRRRFALEQMRTSEQVAQYVALQRVGFDVDVIEGDVLIQDMVCLAANEDNTECVDWSPSDDVLDPGDRILEADGERIDGVEDLGRVLEGRAPGDIVTMRIDRPEAGELEVEVELTASPDDPDRTIVGFFPFDTRRVELPFDLDIDTGSIGGPSAGLAFTLTLIDELTEGELTGGADIAVTGTIELDGSVGPIGGLRQKASAVAQTGVDVFLVPGISDAASEAQRAAFEAELEAARQAGGDDLRIIPVRTLEEALTALESLGGDPIPPAPEQAADTDGG
ncbi:MAG: S16 family serine protease [Ilumatobacteraceae bacterium]|nr:S16 family serine protease [Ilumatobacteraceae bacterium]